MRITAFVTNIFAWQVQLASKNCVASIYYDPYDAEVVKTSSELLATDVEAVTGKKPALVTTSDAKDKQYIIAGTIGGSDLIKSLANSGKIGCACEATRLYRSKSQQLYIR